MNTTHLIRQTRSQFLLCALLLGLAFAGSSSRAAEPPKLAPVLQPFVDNHSGLSTLRTVICCYCSDIMKLLFALSASLKSDLFQVRDDGFRKQVVEKFFVRHFTGALALLF